MKIIFTYLLYFGVPRDAQIFSQGVTDTILEFCNSINCTRENNIDMTVYYAVSDRGST